MTFRTESRISIASSVPEVWAYLCDVERWPEWAPRVLECWVPEGIRFESVHAWTSARGGYSGRLASGARR